MRERPNEDCRERYIARHKWYPERIHMGGVGGGDMDHMSDESFYKPSTLGVAHAEPKELVAATENGLKLTFCAGSAGVPQGADVHFNIRARGSLGGSFQISEPKSPGFIYASGPNSCEIQTFVLGFRVKKGSLREGDTVVLTVKPFIWTHQASKREFKVSIDLNNGTPEQRLSEPAVITILPRFLSQHIEATVPCTRKDDSRVRVHITARDELDNRVPQEGTVSVRVGDKTITTHMSNGLADCYLKPSANEPVRARATHEEGNLECESNICIPSSQFQLYIGDLHAHDFLSQARQYTDLVYRWAIEDRNLDFLSVPPQVHGWLDNETWTIAKYFNERYLNEGEFVTFLAFEWQHSGYGDKVVHFLGGDQPYLATLDDLDDPRYNTPKKIYKTLRTSDAIVISHHSSYPLPDWVPGTDFELVETDVERLVELWSKQGSSEGYDKKDRPLRNFDPTRNAMEALRKGLRLGFVAGSDNHFGTPGGPGGSTKEPRPYWGGLAAVWAESLTRRSIFSALHARRTYALTGARIIMKMTVNGVFMGSELPLSQNANICIDVWAPGKIKKVEVMKNTFLLSEHGPFRNECHLQVEDKPESAAFYHCRVTQEDGHLAVCSPVWLG